MKSTFDVCKELATKTINLKINEIHSEMVVGICSAKQMPPKISENSQENTCAGVLLLIKLQASCNFLKQETPTQVFPCEFCKTFWSNLFTGHCGQLCPNINSKL